MASYIIKEEPIDFNEDFSDGNKNVSKTLIDKQYELELAYLNNVNENLLNLNADEEIELFNEMVEINQNKSLNVKHMNENKRVQLNSKNYLRRDQQIESELTQEHDRNNSNKLKQQNQTEQMAFEKKRIINALIESAKEKEKTATINRFEPFSLNDESRILNQLNKLLNDLDENKLNIVIEKSELTILRRLRCKLELRKRKRNLNLPIFDIDSYTNELIDSEKAAFRRNRVKSEFDCQNVANMVDQSNYIDNDDDDIIFEQEILKTTIGDDNSGCEIIAVKNVLDRFEDKNFKFNNHFHHQNQNVLIDNELIMKPIGIVERYDDIKCVISPLTNKVLKPYIRRDYESNPIKLDLIRKINSKNKDLSIKIHPIDYVHLRPEHVFPINVTLRQHFWNGIDISECLEYTDYTIVALYGKLIIGFAFMVPNEAQNQAYLSFIWVHPDWRNLRKRQKNNDVSIGQYMLYYLIQKCENYEIQLHVSVNSSVVAFYQKFGFKIEEYIKNFYDKYYSNETKLSKDAFLMRLSRN